MTIGLLLKKFKASYKTNAGFQYNVTCPIKVSGFARKKYVFSLKIKIKKKSDVPTQFSSFT